MNVCMRAAHRPTILALGADCGACTSAMALAKAKRSRLAELGRSHYVSKSGIEALLNEVLHMPDDELPKNFSRATITAACNEVISEPTSYGTLVQVAQLRFKDGSFYELPYLAPMPLLEHLMSECTPFAEVVWRMLQKQPPSHAKPWRIALYSDEITPGNTVKALNYRKVQSIYWTFLELEQATNENFWFPWCFARSSSVENVEAGMSCIFRAVVLSFFEFNGHSMLTGMILRHQQSTCMLIARIGACISDESALHMMYLNKGASGTMQCLFCSNLTHKTAHLVDVDRTRELVPAWCTDVGRLRFHTSASIYEIMRCLGDVAALGNKGRLELLEQQLGFNYAVEGLLMDERCKRYIDPIDITMYDHQHCLYQNGVFNITVGQFMRRIFPHFKYTDLDEFTRPWRLPRRYTSSTAGLDMASSKRAKSSFEHDIFKCQASEGLGMYPIIRVWIQCVVLPCLRLYPDLAAACNCCLLLFTVCDMIKLTQRNVHSVTGARLHTAIVAFLKSFLDVFGHDVWTFKFHMILHFGLFLNHFGLLLSCYVHERKHKVARRFGNNNSHLQGFEKFVLREVFLTQRAALRRPECFNVVQHISKPSKSTMSALRNAFPNAVNIGVSTEAWVGRGGTVAKGDVACLKSSHAPFGDVVHVVLHAVIDDEVFSLVSRWARIDNEHYTVSDAHEFVRVDDILESLCYMREGNAVQIIPPLGHA